MNLLDAAYNVVHDYKGGAQSLAPRMGKSASTLSHEVAADGSAKLGLLDAEKITHLTGDLRILVAFATNAGQMLVPLPGAIDSGGDDCMVRLAGMAQEFGILCNEVASDLADGKISDNELARIDDECGKMICAVHSMRKALLLRNQSGKPASLRAAA
ncbi:MAG: hypothetical protein H7293_18265 [Candidatus Saccharibacteria bacterium]|nr:hypothetical protein [Rhodoferax sp.]